MLKSLNVPNLLSMLRIALVPVFCIIYFSDLENSRLYSAVVYAVASLTDMLDGFIARRFNKITKLGRILDPMGDKLMCFAVVMCITIDGFIPVWALILLFVKEATMAIGGLIMYERATDIISSNHVGKAATVLFFLVCVAILVFDGISKTTATLLISAALLLTMIALATYLMRFVQVMKTGRTE